jgi:hypothetical protein
MTREFVRIQSACFHIERENPTTIARNFVTLSTNHGLTCLPSYLPSDLHLAELAESTDTPL